ncbi:MAG TPA: SAF domain-containing protein [Actinomycetes bacterium]
MAIGTTLLYLYAEPQNPRAGGSTDRDVLVASEPIPAGTTAKRALAEGSLDIESIPMKDVLEGAVGNIEILDGQVTLVDISPGQQILTTLFGETASTDTE